MLASPHFGQDKWLPSVPLCPPVAVFFPVVASLFPEGGISPDPPETIFRFAQVVVRPRVSWQVKSWRNKWTGWFAPAETNNYTILNKSLIII